MIKNKAKEYCLKIYHEKKISHSKINNLVYNKLEIQPYLREMNADLGMTTFSYRLRMAQYGGNFRGNRGHVPCPLCLSHSDDQNLCFICPVISQHINDLNKFTYTDIFSDNIPVQLSVKLKEVNKFRDDYINSRSVKLTPDI